MKSYLAFVSAAALLFSAAGVAAMPASPQPARHPSLIAVADSDQDDVAAQRDADLQKAQDEFRYWQNRMSEWANAAKAKSAEVSDQAQENIDKAWLDVKADWRKLQNAAPDGWDKARLAFEEASQRLEKAWNNAHQG